MNSVAKAGSLGARASWSAAVLCRFSSIADACESARGLAHSKTWRTFVATYCLLIALFAQVSPLRAQPAAPNHVLELDGNGSFVDLPPNMFNALEEATVEAWVKWRSFKNMSRVFDFGQAYQNMDVQNRGTNPSLRFEISDTPAVTHTTFLETSNFLLINQWFHVAAVSGKAGMRLYLNGLLIGTNDYPGSFAAIKSGKSSFLGRSVWREVSQGDEDFHGQMDEVRVWKVARTQAQIRETMFTPLTGEEANLAALWDFEQVENGVVKDLFHAGHDGRLMGKAKVAEANRPTAVEWPATLSGVVTDETGKPAPDVAVVGAVGGLVAAQTKTDALGRYAMAVTPNLPYALSTAKGELGGVADVRAQPGEQRTLDLIIHPATRVLELDGNGSYVEMPPNIFNDLTEATVEAWARVDESLKGMWMFTYGEEANDFTINLTWEGGFMYGLVSKASGPELLKLPMVPRPNQWQHVAAVSGPGGMKFYVNGSLAGTREFGGSFKSLENGTHFHFGAHADPFKFGSFRGQMDEVRVWNQAHSEEQIRETMFRTLTGTEPGLVGYWNFDDPAQPGRDLSAGGHHGKLMGQARTTSALLPQPAELPRLLTVIGRVKDAGGNPAGKARIKLSRPNSPEVSVDADGKGDFIIPFWDRPTGEFSLEGRNPDQIVWRTGLRLGEGNRQEINLRLSDAFTIAGTVRSLDQTQPIDGVLVQVISLNQQAGEAERLAAYARTDTQGGFKLVHLQPGRYRTRCLIDSGWIDPVGNSVLELKEGSRPPIVQFRVAKPYLGRWQGFTRADGLGSHEIRGLATDVQGRLWVATGNGLSRFDGASWRTFGKEEGIETGDIRQVLACRTGKFWVGTAEGLTRFDASHSTFSAAAQEWKRGAVTRLLETRTGDIWVAFEENGVARFDGRTWTSYTTANGLGDNRVNCLLEDSKGRFWVGTMGGLAAWNGGHWTQYTTDQGLSGNEVTCLLEDKRGQVWAGTGKGLSTFDGQQWRASANDGPSDQKVRVLFEDRQHRIWAGTEGGGVSRWVDDRWQNYGEAEGLANNTVTSLVEDRDGRLWAGTDSGVSRFEGDFWKTYNTANQVGDNRVSCLLGDRQGSLWVGTRSGGVSRLEDFSWRYFGPAEGLANGDIRKLIQDRKGVVWTGTGKGVASWSASGNWKTYTPADGLVPSEVSQLLETRRGDIWVGNQGWGAGGSGLPLVSRYSGASWTNFPPSGGIWTSIRALAEDQTGDVWALTADRNRDRGVNRFDEQRGWTAMSLAEGPEDNIRKAESAGVFDVQAVLPDRHGNVWVGSRAGLSRFDGRAWTHLTKKDGLPEGAVSCLIESRQGKQDLWVGTDQGQVGRFNGQTWKTYTRADGLNGDRIEHLFEDRTGALWAVNVRGAASRLQGDHWNAMTDEKIGQAPVLAIQEDQRGRVWFAQREALHFYDGVTWGSLDSRDGLTFTELTAMVIGRDGEVWLGSGSGVARYQPETNPPRAPEVRLVSDGPSALIRTNGGSSQLVLNRRLTLEAEVADLLSHPSRRKWRFLVSAGSLDTASPTLRNLWQAPVPQSRMEWSTNRVGLYTIGVQYIDRDLNYSEPVLATVLVFAPWYLNAWVMGPGGGLVLGLVGWAFVARSLVIRRKREAERLREQMFDQERHAREAIEAKNAQLESARGALETKAAQLEVAKEAAESARQAAETANQAKSIFLANMSHEIRTPMNAILGYSQILRRDKELPQKHRQSIETIEKSGDHLLGMINDILDLSKIEAGRMELQSADFDLNDLIAGIEAMFRMRCEEKELKLNVVKPADGPIPVHGDEGKLRQVLINLLGNAVKFVDQGEVTLKIRRCGVRGQSESASGDPALAAPAGAVDTVLVSNTEAKAASRLTCRRTPHSEATVYRFDVIDTGPGISEADQKEIFQPFQQSEAGLKKGGTGLGLAITRRQVELMGGEVKLESTLGKGSRFYFEIPLPPAQGRLESLGTKETREVVRLAAGSRVNALVVDDNQNNRDVLSKLLEGIGCRVRAAESALEAFARVEEEVPDIIFMDIRMPGMNGAEATRRIIAEHGPDKIKIVAITASVLEHEKAGHMAAGFHSFLSKPFRFPDVCGSLKQLLKVDFEYADEKASEAVAGEGMDASKCSLPLAVWESLKEAADRYSLTGLKKAMEPLERDGESNRKVADYLKRLVHEGDLDEVSAFLERVKREGRVG